MYISHNFIFFIVVSYKNVYFTYFIFQAFEILVLTWTSEPNTYALQNKYNTCLK